MCMDRRTFIPYETDNDHMILFLGDLNCRYWLVNQAIGVAETQFDESVTAVIQLGDFGLFKTPLNSYFNGKDSHSFIRPVYFIDGNHEDFLFFETLTRTFSRQFTYIPRGSVLNLNGLNFLCLGGSAYMDPVNTPSGAVIRDSDIQTCLSHSPETVDIILTHDCPSDIGVPGTTGFEYCGQTGFSQSRRLRDHFSSKTWLFAHHHQFFEHSDTHGSCFGLPEAHDGFAVMGENGQVILVEHQIDEKGKLCDNDATGQPFCKNINNYLTY